MRKYRENRYAMKSCKWNYKLHFALTFVFFLIVLGLCYLAYKKPHIAPFDKEITHPQTEKFKRLLQTQQDQTFVKSYLKILSNFFSITRSLIVLITVTNSFDFFMPMLVFMEGFMMVGLLTNNKHHLNGFYYDTFNSKLDFMNLIRMGITPQKSEETLEILSRYNFSNLLFFNISGEIFYVLIVLSVILILKALQICFKIQKLRYVNTKFRPVFNALIFYLAPRTLTFVGYQFRSIKTSNAPAILNCILGGIIIILFFIYLFALISQIKKIYGRIQYLEDSRFDIGLARRYDYFAEFEFDCVDFSILYFPALNFFRLALAFTSIGAAPDFHYVQYGMVILTQSFFFLSHISASAYLRIRDRLFYTFSEFAILLLIIMVIVVGLAESVKHHEISLRVEVIIVWIMIALCLSYLIVQSIDIGCALFCEKETFKPKKSGIKILKKGKKKKSTKIIWDESNKDEEEESDSSIRKSAEAKVL